MAAVERMMKIQEVILLAMAKKITWWQATEIIGITDGQMRRWHWRYREYGYDGLLDLRVGKPSPQHQRFQVSAGLRGSAFVPCWIKDLDVVFSVQQQRVISRDNTVVVGGTILQIEPTRWRGTLAGSTVTACERLAWRDVDYPNLKLALLTSSRKGSDASSDTH
jgi:hypothetical protein